LPTTSIWPVGTPRQAGPIHNMRLKQYHKRTCVRYRSYRDRWIVHGRQDRYPCSDTGWTHTHQCCSHTCHRCSQVNSHTWTSPEYWHTFHRAHREAANLRTTPHINVIITPVIYLWLCDVTQVQLRNLRNWTQVHRQRNPQWRRLTER